MRTKTTCENSQDIMNDSAITRIRTSFQTLAESFDTINKHPEPNPNHVVGKIQARVIQGGRLLLKALQARVFQNEAFWQKDPITGWDFESEEEKYLFIWDLALGSWLYKRWPESFRDKAPELFWKHIAQDQNGNPIVGKDGKYLYREDKYTQEGLVSLLREQANICADACRLLAYLLENQMQHQAQHGAKQSKASRVNKTFPKLPDLKWEEVTLEVVSKDSIRIRARGQYQRFMFSDIGFTDKRRGDMPNTRWEVMMELAENEGQISYNMQSTGHYLRSEMIPKAIQDIRKLLKEVLHIEDDPFWKYTPEHGYRCKFQIKDASYR